MGIMLKGGPEIIDYISQANFDFIIPDLMLTGIDWDNLRYMTRAAHAENMGCLPRLESNPFTGDNRDGRLAADAARALALRVDGISASINSPEDIRPLVNLQGDWHRGYAPISAEQVKSIETQSHDSTLIMASIESPESVKQADAIIDVEGLTGIFIAWHDFTRTVGFPLQVEHPEVLKAAERIVTRARKRGLVVMANTGFYYPEHEANAQRIARMCDMGIQLIMVQLVEFVVRTNLDAIDRRVKELGVSVRAPK